MRARFRPTHLAPLGLALSLLASAAGCGADSVLPGLGDLAGLVGGSDGSSSGDMAEASGPKDMTVASSKFSFFVVSMRAVKQLSGSESGFGGDLRYGETGPGAGLRGADKICTAVAEGSLPGSGAKGWHAFLSATDDGSGNQVNAIDRIGNGPWYDRLGRVFALSKANLVSTRPTGADPAIVNDFPNEDGVPNHAPDPVAGQVDNHDMLTGTNTSGKLYSKTATCLDWTSAIGNRATEGSPRVGHSWPRNGGGGPGGGMDNWMSALDEAGCKAGINIIEMGPPNQNIPTVGSGGGYGGFYCFAMVP